MPETNIDRTLMALLEADDSSAVSAAAASDADPEAGLPTLGQRVEMYIRAVYGADAVVTEEMRAAARDHLLTAMADDLAEQSEAIAAPPQHAAVAQSREQVGAYRAPASVRVSASFERVVEGLKRLVAPAADIFTMGNLRLAAVPLAAVLVVGSVWTKDYLESGLHDEAGNPSSVAQGSGDPSDRAKTRSLRLSTESTAEAKLTAEIADAENALGPTHPAVAAKLIDLAGLYRSDRRYPEAETLCKRALSILRQSPNRNDAELVRALNELAAIYRGEGRFKEAEDLLINGK